MADLAAPPSSTRRRALKITAQIVLGLILGLVLTEAAFAWRDDHAFPHLARYVADPELGVRLQPNTSQRLRVHQNPTTTANINTQGYRGADWPEPPTEATPGTGEIVVVGDSQVFGLGVEDDETFSAVLAELTGRPVINAGVPTYGPPEYLAVARELLAARRPESLVYVLHLYNDPFELERPNIERHAVWDGWAVRSETFAAGQGKPRAFPGRQLLMSRSHLIYALRRWWYERNSYEALAELGTPSEGTWHDLIDEGEHEQLAQTEASGAQARSQDRARAEASAAVTELDKTSRDLDAQLDQSFGGVRPRWAQLNLRQPEDIVSYRFKEAGRTVEVTASHIARAVAERRAYAEQLATSERVVAELLREEGALKRQRRTLRETFVRNPPVPAPASMFAGHLRELADLCEAYGTDLTVVALPFDVQVDPGEWVKYGVDDPPDMGPSLVLLDEIMVSAEALGVRAIDLHPALRAASPGAFLDGDIHMTPGGHAAAAAAIAARLTEPPPLLPVPMPLPGLPEDRTLAPLHEDWLKAGEVDVVGSTYARCTTQRIGEWFRVRCGNFFDPSSGYCKKVRRATGIEVLEGRALETMTLLTEESATLVTPLTPGEDLRVRFYREHMDVELFMSWDLTGPEPTFSGVIRDIDEHQVQPYAAAVTRACECHVELYGEKLSTRAADQPCGVRRCRELWGDEGMAEACVEAWPADCRALLGCVQHDPLFAPSCPRGSVHAFASNRCFALCDEQRPCSSGATCTPYRGSAICLPEPQTTDAAR